MLSSAPWSVCDLTCAVRYILGFILFSPLQDAKEWMQEETEAGKGVTHLQTSWRKGAWIQSPFLPSQGEMLHERHNMALDGGVGMNPHLSHPAIVPGVLVSEPNGCFHNSLREPFL